MSGGVLFVVSVPSCEQEAKDTPGLAAAASMETALNQLIESFRIHNCAWNEDKCGSYKQVIFSVECGYKCDEILHHLSESGIGTRPHSTVSVIPCSLYWETEERVPGETVNGKNRKEEVSAWNKLVASIQAKLTIAQVVEGVKTDAQLTFDFLVLLLIAGLVAALGLLENNTGILVASMLISPLMGPIMAGTFGTIIRDSELTKMGLLNEMFGLLLCVLEGFICGIIVWMATGHFGTSKGPTDEMIYRGELHSFWIGIIIALLSGVGVAISILGDNTASLVGVAISASLMPPAVNAGLLWAVTIMHLIYNTEPELSSPHLYAQNGVAELGILGAMSLSLTFINIICIFVAGIIVLKLKAVAPRTSLSHQKFWKHDVKLAREYNQTFYGNDASSLAMQVADLSTLSASNRKSSAELRTIPSLNLFHHTQDVMKPSYFNVVGNQSTWSPSTYESSKFRSLRDLYHPYICVSPPISQLTSIKVTSPLHETIGNLGTISEGESTLSITPCPSVSDDQAHNSRRFFVTPVQEARN